MLTLHIDGTQVPLILIATSHSESYVRVDDQRPPPPIQRALITYRFQSNDHFLDLILITDLVYFA